MGMTWTPKLAVIFVVSYVVFFVIGGLLADWAFRAWERREK